jgi:pseudouridine synthase
VAVVGVKVDPQNDAIKVDGKRIQPSDEQLYFLLNKPKGYMTTRSDPEGRPTVYDLLAPGLRSRVIPVGRLDYQTEGLLVMTSDGDLAERVTHPRYGCLKTYRAKVKGVPTESQVDRLRGGIVLDGKRTLPAEIVPQSGRRGMKNSWYLIKLKEGRTRQIREMFFRIGHPVLKLQRVAIGGVSDRRLPAGSYRELDESEVRTLLAGGRRKPRR